MTPQQLLIIFLPIGIPALASMLAAALAQDGFDKFATWLNPLIAYFFLIAAAVGTAYAEGQLTADGTGVVTVGTFVFSLAVSGGLHALTPWLKFLSLIQSYFFAIVKASHVTPTPQAKAPVIIPQRPQMPTPIPATLPQPLQAPAQVPVGAIPNYTPVDVRQFQLTGGNVPTVPRQ